MKVISGVKKSIRDSNTQLVTIILASGWDNRMDTPIQLYTYMGHDEYNSFKKEIDTYLFFSWTYDKRTHRLLKYKRNNMKCAIV